MGRLATVAAAAALIQSSFAHCPNFCNGHGRCVGIAKCECFGMWTGGDCSQRKCPSGVAWSDKAIGVDIAHQPAECSNRGNCNRQTGQCECMEGYEGLACNRMECPEWCSTHGECNSMRIHAANMDKGLIISSEFSADVDYPEYPYTTRWDADLIHGCTCDANYDGWNCQKRVCPAGDDPLTTGQTDEVQLLRCDLNPNDPANVGDRFTLSFRGIVTRPFPPSASAADIRALLEELPNIGGVSVSFSRGISFCNADFSGVNPSGNVISITFLTEHGDVPSLLVLDQYGGLLAGEDDNAVEVAVNGGPISYSTSTGSAQAYSVLGTKESLPCSGRGDCDTRTGECKCFTGFYASDGRGNSGTIGDCGYVQLPVTACPGFPNECSGHGTCSGSPAYKCTCFEGYQGGDCSERTCPRSNAWFDYPTGPEKAHASAECSNKGECDRNTGQCKCQRMFEGSACERMTCPGSDSPWGVCNGHGRCMTMFDLAKYSRTDNGDPIEVSYGKDPNSPSTWDAKAVLGCNCDDGWSGYDCSLRTCLDGYDITLLEADESLVDEIQEMYCQSINPRATTTFRLSFRGEKTNPISYSATAADIKQELEALSTVGRINVVFNDDNAALTLPVCASGPGTRVIFRFETEHGDVPPIRVVMGRKTASGGYADGDGFISGDLVFWGGDPDNDYRGSSPSNMYRFDKLPPAGYHGGGIRAAETRKGTTSMAECSGRGTCDRELGVCKCYPGFGSSNGNRGPGDREDCGWREPLWPKI